MVSGSGENQASEKSLSPSLVPACVVSMHTRAVWSPSPAGREPRDGVWPPEATGSLPGAASYSGAPARKGGPCPAPPRGTPLPSCPTCPSPTGPLRVVTVAGEALRQTPDRSYLTTSAGEIFLRSVESTARKFISWRGVGVLAPSSGADGNLEWHSRFGTQLDL